MDQKKDETEKIIQEELMKDADRIAETTKAPARLNVLPVDAPKFMTSSSLVDAFKKKMSTNTTSVELPLQGKTVEFKDIDSRIQSKLSQISLECGSRTDIMFTTMLNTLNGLATDKSFNIRNLSEFERIAILLSLQQSNKFNPDVKFVCPKCGKENHYRLDFRGLMKKFHSSYRSEASYSVVLGGKKYDIVLAWPDVHLIEEFYRSHFKDFPVLNENSQKAVNELAQIQYLLKFVKAISVSEEGDPSDKISVNLSALAYSEREEIMESLPSYLASDDEEGIVVKVIDMFVKPMNDAFKYDNCAFCGAEQEEALANLTDFMGG